MIDCIIIDDEEHAIEVIIHYAKALPNLNILATFTSPIDALTFLNNQKVDLILLDIHMPEVSGIEFIESTGNRNFKFILTTAYKEFASKGFDLNVIDYLVKPISASRFLQAILKAEQTIQTIKPATTQLTDKDYFMVKTEAKGKMIKINVADIDLIEGMKNYIAFHHNGTRTLALLNMKDVEKQLPKALFARVQKSFIVALSKIVQIDGNRIIVENVSTEIWIGETYKKDFLDLMQKKMFR